MTCSLLRRRATGSVSFISVERGRTERSFSGSINKKKLHPQGVTNGLITARMSCLAAWQDVWRTCLEECDPGRWHPSERSQLLPLEWWSQPPVPSFMTYNYRLRPVHRHTFWWLKWWSSLPIPLHLSGTDLDVRRWTSMCITACWRAATIVNLRLFDARRRAWTCVM